MEHNKLWIFGIIVGSLVGVYLTFYAVAYRIESHEGLTEKIQEKDGLVHLEVTMPAYRDWTYKCLSSDIYEVMDTAFTPLHYIYVQIYSIFYEMIIANSYLYSNKDEKLRDA